ncbi:EamA family transporter, partial [Burkholderia pseudomallei]
MRAQTANRGPPPHKTDDRRPRVALSWHHFSTSIRAARAMPMSARTNAAFTALLAAALFGATTPLAKTLLGSLTPFMVAGLFY